MIVIIPMIITVFFVSNNFKEQSYQEADLKIKNTIDEVMNQLDDLQQDYANKVKAFARSSEIALPTYTLQRYSEYFKQPVKEQLLNSIASSSLLFNLALDFDVIEIRDFNNSNQIIVAIENQQRVVKKFFPDNNDVINNYKEEKAYFLNDDSRLLLQAQAPIIWKGYEVGLLIIKKYITADYLKSLQTAQGISISVLDKNKVLVSTAPHTLFSSDFFKENGVQDKIIRDIVVEGEPYNFAYHTLSLNGFNTGKVLVGFSTQATRLKIFNTKLIIFETTFYSLLLAVIIIIFFSNIFTKPIKKMNEVTNEIVKGNLDKQVDYKSKDELGELVRNFNQMVLYYKNSRDNLYQMKEFQENILESIKEGMVVINKENIIQSLNQSMIDFFQIKKENYIGEDLYKLSAFKQFKMDFWQVIEEEGSFVMNDFIYQDRNRTYIINMRVYPLYNRYEDIYGAVIILEDISKKVELEKQLLLNDKLASMGRFTAGIAHEINNPLGTIINYVETILYDEKDEAKKIYLGNIKKETQRIATIVQGLLNFSRQSKSEFGIVDIREVIELSLQICQYQNDYNKFKIYKEFEENISYVMGNFNQLQQVAINMILNAYESMEEGDNLSIKIETTIDRNYIRIIFVDTGPGIEPHYLKNVFDPFFTTKDEKGMGLGLSISYGIIKNHGGDILVNSELGTGTTFIIKLPVYKINQIDDNIN